MLHRSTWTEEPVPAAVKHLEFPQEQEKDQDKESCASGWTVHASSGGRLYYCNHLTRSVSWLPPPEAWPHAQAGADLPFGWEQALDANGKHYYINHVNRTTSYQDPRTCRGAWTDADEAPHPRTVRLLRHPEQGFGFVAGSERPVIVRFVTEGGPSDGQLQPGDQILSINNEDVKDAPRDRVIQLVRACSATVTLLVCQPPLDNSARKSALLSAAKKAKLKSNPSRVRFAEGVAVSGAPLFPPSTFAGGETGVPFLPNVLKVFLENGQTKSFKYDGNTTVRDVVTSLQQKLCLKATDHFALTVEHVKSLRRNKLTLLDPDEPLSKIAARPGAHNLRCLFRVAFVPRDACQLAQRDLTAFEYLYLQCCNDVVQERYAPELKYDMALRLAALHIHQHAVSNNMTGKVTVKAIEREFGLERFVPVSLMETMKRKELRKIIGHFLKMNQNMSTASGLGHKSLTSLQAKLYYLNIISQLPSYGAKCFSTNIRDTNMETVILVSPKFGISQIVGMRNSLPVPLADIEQMVGATVTWEDEISRCVRISIPTLPEKELVLSMEDRDADELVLVLQGYYKLLTEKILPVTQNKEQWASDTAPPYHTQHSVIAAPWSYAIHDSENPIQYATFTVPPTYVPLPDIPIGSHHITANGGPPSVLSIGKSVTFASHANVYQVDNNMNNMTDKLHEAPPSQDSGFDLQSVLSMEILEGDLGLVEARNEEVLRRVAEMQELVQNSEQYLTQQQEKLDQPIEDQQHCENGDVESAESGDWDGVFLDSDAPPPGQLKHSDSLLLLTQGQRLAEDVSAAIAHIDIGETEPSESDTDSLSTPTESPSHRPTNGVDGEPKRHSMLRPSDSSFGLHSPDTDNLRPGSQHFQDLLARMQAESVRPEDTFCLDPDIIDLTAFPPPVTPDEEGLAPLPSPLSVPPTPFADQTPLETQLNNLERMLGGAVEPDCAPSEALLNAGMSLDLEAFLRSVVVPPPSAPASAPVVELTPEEISSFIIPPPPSAPVAAVLSCKQPGSDNSRNHFQNHTNGNMCVPYVRPAPKVYHCSPMPPPIPVVCVETQAEATYGNIQEFDGTSAKSINSENGFSQPVEEKLIKPTESAASKQRVIEYPTIEKKVSPFSCCGKYRDSPDKSPSPGDPPSPLIAPPTPPRAAARPPDRPPKSITLSSANSNSCLGSVPIPTPSLPPRPRKDANLVQLTPPQVWLPPKHPMHSSPSHHGTLRRVAQVTPLPAAARIHTNRDYDFNNCNGPVSNTISRTNGSAKAIVVVDRTVNGHPGIRIPGTPPLKPRNPQHFNTLPAKPRTHQLSVYDAMPEVWTTATEGNGDTIISCHNGLIPNNRSFYNGQIKASEETQVNQPGPSDQRVPMWSKRTLLAKTEVALGGLLDELDAVADQCGHHQQSGGGPLMDEDKFQIAKEALGMEARQLVTASKQLVRSITDSSNSESGTDLPTHLTCCLTLLRRLTQLSTDLCQHTSSPLQTRNLVLKVRHVAQAFRATINVSSPETSLPQRAENLASVLAALLRALRIFSP